METLEQSFKLSNGSVCNENDDCKSNECLHNICVISDNNKKNTNIHRLL